MARLSYSSRCALVVDLVRKLRERGSWCGETHLQKALYILQDITKSSFGYKFVIYKHGPYSFDLDSELTAMKAAHILEFQFPREGYGPSITITAFGDRVSRVNKENVEQFLPASEFVVEWFGNSGVRELERLATAYYVTRKNFRWSPLERAKKLRSLKPHIDIQSAEEAIRIVDEKLAQVKQRLEAAA